MSTPAEGTDRLEPRRPRHRRRWLIAAIVVFVRFAVVVGGGLVWWNQRVGRTTVVVGGTRVPALHYSQSFKLTGDQSGAQHEDFWLAAANGLPLQEERTISVNSPAPSPLNQVTYTEHGSWRLTSLTPRT